MEQNIKNFIDQFINKASALSTETAKTYFNATISGNAEDFKKASELEYKLNMLYADKNAFLNLKKFKEEGGITDPLLARQIELLYNDFVSNQYDQDLLKQIIELSTKTEEKYSVFRAEVDGKRLTDNQIDDILKESTDSEKLENTWKASKQIGKIVENDVKKLVELRNEAARQLGYKNHHQMSLSLGEQNPEEIERLFDELDRLTREEFRKVKAEMDEHLSQRYGVPVEELKPWHYQDKFFQQGPEIHNVDFDRFYKDKDPVKITSEYYKSIGLDVDDLIEKSDLYEKEGKYQHAYCMDIDREGDVRVVANVRPNHRWTSTLLHEYGHAAYDKFIDKELPWIVRTHAHIFTTEAIAMLFGRFASIPEWISDVLGVERSETEKIKEECLNSLKAEQLVFSRWVQVMYRFEKEMYNNPDQDLNALWWSLVERYQEIKKPEGRNEPDWASKIHVALYPAYYHNYMLGELLASQLYFVILENNGNGKTSLYKNSNAGSFLKEKLFKPGASLRWDELIKKATGRPLTPEFYAKQFVS